MFTLFCIVLALPPIAILILSICIFRIRKKIDDINDILCENVFEELDVLEESVDNILAYLEGGGEAKKK